MRFNANIILFTLVFMLVLSGAACAGEVSADGAAAVRADITKLPLSFIPNQGQADPAVLFQSKAEDHSIFFTEKNVVLTTQSNGNPVVFSTTVAGANPGVTVTGVGLLPGTANFFIGDNPAAWHRGIQTYAGVEYQNILPGIDLTYRGTNGVLKREFTVAPGADASGIVIVYDGIDGLAYGADNTLLITTPAGVLTETAPVCFQVINGNRVDVAAQYSILGDGKVGFNFGPYDTTKELVIDPALVYSSYLGGALNDHALGIAVNSTGEAFVTGNTESTNFPVSGSSINSSSNGCSDVFVTKVSADGKSLVYSTYLGGNNTDSGNGIAVNGSGYAFITGNTASLNFPIVNGTPKNANTTSPSPCPFPGCLAQDAFVSVISPDGLSLPYSTCIGGNLTDVGNSIAVSSDGGLIYITGYTCSDNFPPGSSAVMLQPLLNKGVPSSASDAFVAELGYGTGAPLVTTYWGGSDNDQGLGIARTDDGINKYVYVTGWTQSTNLTTTPGAFWSINSGGKDGFVTKFVENSGFTTSGGYSTYLGGSGNDEINGIMVANVTGAQQYAHVTGVTYSPDFPTTPGALYEFENFYTSQFGDAFITKFQPTGQLNWSSYLGGSNNDGGAGITLDAANNIFVTGYTSSPDFPVKNALPTFNVKHPFQDAFITMVDSNLTSLNFSTFLGGNLDDSATGIGVSDPKNIFVSGFTTSYDFPSSLGGSNITSFNVYHTYFGNRYAGWVDGFVVHINNAPTPAMPSANFNVSIPSSWGCLPIPVTFMDTSTGGPTAWQWNFGDGTANSTEQNPVHWYSSGGNVTVTLTVSNSLGMSSIAKIISVPTSASPKFTEANSTTAIGSIHIPQNGTHKVSLYLNATPQGLSGYNLTLSFRNTTPPIPYVPNTTVANITNVSRPEWIPQNVNIFEVSNLSADGYNVTFQGADINLVINPGALNVRLANLTIHGNERGNSTLHINSTNMLTDDFGRNMTLCPADYNLTVYVERLQPIPASIALPPAPLVPTDPNGDGLYEDVNGNGVYNYDDVIDFFTYLWWITDNYGQIDDDTNEYQPFFDFDGNRVVNYMDVITLYYKVPLLI